MGEVMKDPTIAIGQIEVIPGDPRANAKKMLEFIAKARLDHANIVIFPELCIPGYLIGDMWERTDFLKECEECGEEIREASEGIVVIFGNIAMDWKRINEDGRVRKYNACFVAENGKFKICNQRENFFIKTLQPNYREFDDNRHFYDFRKYIDDMESEYLPRDYRYYPVTVMGNITIGCILCEDGWDTDYSWSPIQEFVEQGCDFIVNISCSPFTSGKSNKRDRVFSAHAKNEDVPIIYVNNVGLQDNGKTLYTFDGDSCVYLQNGRKVVFEGPMPFEEGLFVFDFVSGPISWNVVQNRYCNFANEINDEPQEDDMRTIFFAIRYGIKKFMERFGIKSVVIGASGGIDSAVCAALFSTVVEPENLFLINMPSRFNSNTTKELAKELADNLGCNYQVIPIEESVMLTSKQMAIKVPDSDRDDLVVVPNKLGAENIQARDRSSRVLAGVAATVGGVFTCNANKSEMTVGYTTMYGDLGGFIAPLADLWKTQVYELGRWINANISPRNRIPEGCFDIKPSAELSDKQVDPFNYEYHDLLFKSWVERWERATPADIIEWMLKGTIEKELGWFNKASISLIFDHDMNKFVADLERWWNCYQGLAIAKRIQAPPVLAVSRRAFGFDHREAQLPPRYSKRYEELKEALFNGERITWMSKNLKSTLDSAEEI